MLISNSFVPPLLLRPAHIQTLLASSTIRAWGNNAMREAAQEMILETPEGVRLLGFYSAQSLRPAKGFVILLHGWEGSVTSTYILRTGKKLYRNGYNTFRLNFRDHGDSHQLNKGIFYGSSRDYFKAYSVLDNAIENITVPSTIITSADDPIIPVEDFSDLHTNDLTNMAIQSYGGHNGFLKKLTLESWYEQQLVELFDEIVGVR